MKRTIYTITALLAFLLLAGACVENRNIYDAEEYVMCADTLKVYPV